MADSEESLADSDNETKKTPLDWLGTNNPPPVQYIRPVSIPSPEPPPPEVITKLIKEPSLSTNLAIAIREGCKSRVKSFWGNLRSDVVFCREAFRTTFAETGWAKMIATITHANRAVNFFAGMGLVAVIVTLYIAFIYPLAGNVGTVIVLLSLLVFASIVTIRVTRKLYEQTAASSSRAQSHLAGLQGKIETLEANIKQITESLTASEQRYAELTKTKVIFELDEISTRVFITKDPALITARLKIRFQNKEPYDEHLKTLRLTLHDYTQSGEILTWILNDRYFGFSGGNEVEIPRDGFEGMLIQAKRLTPWYVCVITIDLMSDEKLKISEELTNTHYLMVTMDATNQEPFKTRILVNWEKACNKNGTAILSIGAPAIRQFEDRRILESHN